MKLKPLALAVAASFALGAPAFAADDMKRGASAQGATDRSLQSSGGATSDRMHSGMSGGMQQSSSTVRQAQQALQDKGHDVGPIDGIMGPKTSAALRDFQQAQGLKTTGRLDPETLSALDVQATPGASGASDRMSRAGSNKGPTVSSDAKSPSPSSTQSGKTSSSASGTAPNTSTTPPSASGSASGGATPSSRTGG